MAAKRIKALFDDLVREHSKRGDNARQQAATSQLMMQMKPHGFVYPAGLPPCGQCGYSANEGAHVNPPKIGNALSFTGGERRIISADQQPMRRLHKTHVYASGYTNLLRGLTCQACGGSLDASAHTPGMPIGMASTQYGVTPQTASENEVVDDSVTLKCHEFEALDEATLRNCAMCGYTAEDEVHVAEDGVVVKRFRVTAADAVPPLRTDVDETQKAFVTQVNGKTILTGPASIFTEPDEGLPRELAAAWEKASEANPHFLWLEGRYVEADMPNRNAAAWNTEDLTMGEPTVAHGPLNWLHEERHIIGAIAAAKLVLPDREAANEGSRATIRALAPVWRYLYPTEARVIAAAGEDRKLWYSMECISREVACMGPECEHSQSYVEYMKQPHTRCPHVKDGGPRRFADPSFLGGAVIVPPVRPGWGGANATVLRQAAMLAERQEASLSGLSEEEAVYMVASIIRYAGGDEA